MSEQNEYINTLSELNNLRIGQSIEARGYFSCRGVDGLSVRTLQLTVKSIDDYTKDRLFVDQEGENWTSVGIYNIVDGDSSGYIKY
ncbi:hypothetical protein MHB43_23775 [Paenibacillus sp. FSL H8-0317]|uniref:hypothetical protein n=1 Tax=Paenibacillus sp. FSL H8-0317 TaxID=2921385 RepID=UPI00325209C6